MASQQKPIPDSISFDVPEDDFEPDPALCEDPLQIIRDAKAGKRTFLDLLTEAQRAELLECIK